jgi:hypothetical protein
MKHNKGILETEAEETKETASYTRLCVVINIITLCT